MENKVRKVKEWEEERTKKKREQPRENTNILFKWFFHNFERRISWKLFSERKFRHAFLLCRYSLFVRWSHSHTLTHTSVFISPFFGMKFIPTHSVCVCVCLLSSVKKVEILWVMFFSLVFRSNFFSFFSFFTCVFSHISYSHHQKYPTHTTHTYQLNESHPTNTTKMNAH